MDRLSTRVNRTDSEYLKRQEHNHSLIATLRERLNTASQGGGGKYVERHRGRGKLLPRERIERIIDPGTAFLELSPLAAHELYDGRAHSAGIVTGVGLVHGRECLFVANDATVKGGSYYPMTVKKHIRAQTVAHENHLPCIYLVDSGGAFLPMQDEVFPGSSSAKWSATPDCAVWTSAPPNSSAVTSSPVAALTSGGPARKIVPLPLTIIDSSDIAGT